MPQRPERFSFRIPSDTPQSLVDYFRAVERTINLALYDLGEGDRILPDLAKIPDGLSPVNETAWY